MAKRKKKRPRGTGPVSPEPTAPEPAPKLPSGPEKLNSPFATALAGMKVKPKRKAPPKKKAPSSSPSPSSARAHEREAALGVSRRSTAPVEHGYEDRVALRQAMADVAPIGKKTKRASRAHAPVAKAEPLDPREEGRASRAAREAAEDAARARLDDLVGGGVRFEVQRDDDGAVFGRREGAHPSHLAALRRGGVVPDATFDLHGLHADEAAREVRSFVRGAHRDGHRVVLIVHGKGRHSEGRQGVLEDRVVDVLTRGGAAPVVLAFSSAPERLGGRGAIVVRLGER